MSTSDSSSENPTSGNSGSETGTDVYEVALERALAARGSDGNRSEDEETGTDPNSTETGTNGQAPGSTGDSDDGASSQAGTVETATDGDGASDQNESGDSTSTESPEAPGSWPEERKEAFNKLPREAQALLSDSYKEMEGGLNKALEKLSAERNQMKENFGADPDALRELVQKAQDFEADPVPVLTALAEQAGVEIFFTPQGEDEIPDFETQKEQTEWLLKKQKREANQALADTSRAQAGERAQRELQSKIQEEFAHAHQAHPDLADHRDTVVQLMAEQGVSVESAYRLATYDGLGKLAAEAQKAKADLEKANAELEKLKKGGTRPPAGVSGNRKTGDDEPADPYEAALSRAQRRINQG